MYKKILAAGIYPIINVETLQTISDKVTEPAFYSSLSDFGSFS